MPDPSSESFAELLLTQLHSIEPWMEEAACKDTPLDPFWDEETQEFKRDVCGECPVIEQCRGKFAGAADSERVIEMGVFHGVNYGEE